MVGVSPDAPSVRTLPEFQRLGDVDRTFRDDKSAGFGIERVRLTTPHRLDRLLLGVAIAQVLLTGLEPGVRWIPPRSFEERNLMM